MRVQAKVAAGLMALILLGPLAACGSDGGEDGSAAPGSTEPTTIDDGSGAEDPAGDTDPSEPEGTEADPGEGESSDASEPGPTPSPGGTACVSGEWSLDLAHYTQGMGDWMRGMGTPFTAFEITGSGTLTITQTGGMELVNDFVINSTLSAGGREFPSSIPSRYVAEGEWSWTPQEGDTAIYFERWDEIERPDDTEPFFGADTGTMDCDGDVLVIEAGGPVPARYVRVG